MCNPSEQNRISENERIKQVVSRQHEWWEENREIQDKITFAYNRWQDAIHNATKDRHPVDGEPLDLE